MLGLPSTTSFDNPVTKTQVYRNTELSAPAKQEFTSLIDSIAIANMVNSKTMNITLGEHVTTIMVWRIDLKECAVPELAIEALDKMSPAKNIFVCVFDDDACLAVRMTNLVIGPWQPVDQMSLNPDARSLDDLWDTLASQIVYGDTGDASLTVEERYALDQKLQSLRDEIAKKDVRCRKEKQFAKRNALWAEVKKLKEELSELEKGK